jgi:glycosyltransferase involved in cell wall biosynthesis
MTGLLTPVGDADKLAAAALLLLSDPVKMQSMGRAGRERILQKFRNETVWEALASLYETMLQERGYPLPADSHVEVARCVQAQ